MKTKTDLRAGANAGPCPSKWSYGTVEKSTGGGFYGSVRGNYDDLIHYFNLGYTQFFPPDQGVSVGQQVAYAAFPAGNPRAGKVACMQSSSYGPYY